MAHEEWRDVVGYEGYQVSNLGNVRSIDREVAYPDGHKKFVRGAELSLTISKYGFRTVLIYHKVRINVDEAVANAFVSKGKPGQLVFHIDGDFGNCVPKNLIWLDETRYFEECYRTRYDPDPNEQWRDIAGYEGLYEVSNLGNVRSHGRVVEKRGGGLLRMHSVRLEPISRPSDGGANVSLVDCVKKRHAIVPVERLVADAFVAAKGDSLVLTHANGDVLDNRACNLRWVAQKELVRWGAQSGIEQEAWRPVVGFEGYYEVSSYGAIKSVDRYVDGPNGQKRHVRCITLRQHANRDGYMCVTLSKNGSSTTLLVHRIVAQAFLEGYQPSLSIDHVNGIRNDNRVSNLDIVTRKENNRRRSMFSKNMTSSPIERTRGSAIVGNDDGENEEWRDVEGYEGLYQVSDLGRVRSVPRTFYNSRGSLVSKPCTVLSQRLNVNGYCAVWMYKDRKRHYNVVHRMVAKAFVPNPNGYPCVDHINADRTDARACNLRWCTQKQNMRYAIESGRIPRGRMNKLKSPETEEKRLRKISKAVVRDDGKVYESQIAAARELGYASESAVRDVATGKRESCRGHTFRYVA